MWRIGWAPNSSPTVKPEAATAVVELLMMGLRTPETCWAVFKRQVINLRNCCIWLVDSFECMMMHGLANPKSTVIFDTFATKSFTKEHDHLAMSVVRLSFLHLKILTPPKLFTWQSTVHGHLEDGLKNGTESCRGKFLSVFNVNLVLFKVYIVCAWVGILNKYLHEFWCWSVLTNHIHRAEVP
jgi:hypothetical protein